MNCCALLLCVSLTVGQTPVDDNLKLAEPLIGEWVETYVVPEGKIGTLDHSGFAAGARVPATAKYSWGSNGQPMDLYFGLVVDGVETPITRELLTWRPKPEAIVGFDSYANSIIGQPCTSFPLSMKTTGNGQLGTLFAALLFSLFCDSSFGFLFGSFFCLLRAREYRLVLRHLLRRQLNRHAKNGH